MLHEYSLPRQRLRLHGVPGSPMASSPASRFPKGYYTT
ncbi:hypothetical protein DVDV_3170 [Desulfovibrio sp. DV]|nr:hypothetical protein DVDV_3170 [Desulfovibrio sp. DV]